MNINVQNLVNPLASVAITTAPENLATITQPQNAAAIWQRNLQPDFRAWINTLDPANLPHGRVILPVAKVAETVTQLCEIAQTPDTPERALLINDITTLAGLFSGIMDAPYLRLRLDVVETNACRKFHIDAITARLVCTYRGTGTQYGQSQNGQDPQRVFTVPTGAPIMLRGTLWPTTPNSGLKHRSPPIEGTGENRLVLVLDPCADPDGET